MTAFHHILVATDFSESSARAVELAARLATESDAKLTLFHATWLPPSTYASYAEGLPWPVEQLADAASKSLAAAFGELKKRYPRAESAIATGDPWETILSAALERGADLIVIGTHGRRGISRALIGSVAEKVVRLSPIPVLTVRAPAGP